MRSDGQGNNAADGTSYRESDFCWEMFDALPVWCRMYVAFHPYPFHLDPTRRSLRLLQTAGPVEAAQQMKRWAEKDAREVRRAALEVYGPDHPQAQTGAGGQ